MNLIKFGIAGVIVTCAVAVACSGSSSSNGNGSGAGSSNSSAGTSSSTGGSSSSTGGGSANTGGTSASQGGTTSGTTCNPMMPGDTSCPAATTCIETNCKTQLDSCGASTGPCADYIKCATPCNCDQTCVSKCTQSATCKTCINSVVNCELSNCIDASLSCASGGTGAGGTGAGGSFSFGGNAGTFPGFDAGTATCADLSKCCATLAAGQEKDACTQIVSGGIDAVCSISLSGLCPAQ